LLLDWLERRRGNSARGRGGDIYLHFLETAEKIQDILGQSEETKNNR